MNCVKHRKPMATKYDLNEYESRKECVKRGDCDCHLCSKVCWLTACKNENEKEPKR